MNESFAVVRFLGTRDRLRVDWWLLSVLVVLLAPLGVVSGQSYASGGANYWPVSSATSRLETLLAKTASVSNVAATLLISIEPSQGSPPSRYAYYRSASAGISRFEVVGIRTTRTTSGTTVISNEVSSEVVYARLVDEGARRVYVQSHGQLAVFDAHSAAFWLSAVDLLSGNPRRFSNGAAVYYVGSDVVNNSNTDVFFVDGTPQVKLWVDTSNGIVCKVHSQNMTYELVDCRINAELDKGLFVLDTKGKDVPEISEQKVGQWWPTTVASQSGEPTGSESLTIDKAALQGNVEAVNRFLRTDPQLANARGEHGRTPLHSAAIGGHTNVVDLLLANGADVDPKDDDGTTPLLCAVADGHNGVVKLLISKGADVNGRGLHGFTPLIMAVFKGYKDMVEFLLDNGANVNSVDEVGRRSLDYAVLQHRDEILQLLRRHGATE